MDRGERKAYERKMIPTSGPAFKGGSIEEIAEYWAPSLDDIGTRRTKSSSNRAPDHITVDPEVYARLEEQAESAESHSAISRTLG